MNFATLITDMKQMIGPAGKGSEVSNSGLGLWLNDAYDMVKSLIIDVIPDYFTKQTSTASIASQQEYELPTDFEKMVQVSVTYDGTNYVKATPLNNLNQSDISQSAVDSFNVASPFYYIYKNKIGLEPTPTITADDAVKVWYSYTPAELNEDTDEPDLPRRFQSILKFWAYANYLDQNDEHTAAERMRVRFDVQLERLVQQLAEQQVDQPKTVEITDNQDLYVGDY